MEQAINYWIMEYHREGFVRWSILDCTSSTAIGTMELFKRSANDVYDNTAVLRLDLLSKYEETILSSRDPFFDSAAYP